MVVLAHPPLSTARFRTCIPAEKSPGWERGLAAAPPVMVAVLRSSFPASSTPCPTVGGWVAVPPCWQGAQGCRDPPWCHRSPFPGTSGSCSSSSPGVQVMLQPGSTASTEPGEQRGGGLHFRGSLEAFSAAFLAGKRNFASFLHLRSCIFTLRL